LFKTSNNLAKFSTKQTLFIGTLITKLEVLSTKFIMFINN